MQRLKKLTTAALSAVILGGAAAGLHWVASPWSLSGAVGPSDPTTAIIFVIVSTVAFVGLFPEPSEPAERD